jgi:hypothetical protein|tara:strand:- start:900 stop:1193 length:294 start_codon:yes stop_codon:yes gene_type:complete
MLRFFCELLALVVPGFMALLAESNEIINVEPLRRVCAYRNNVMNLGRSTGDSFCLTIFAKWIAYSVMLAKPSPAMIISSCSGFVALCASVAGVCVAL